MRILLITQIALWPADAGPKIKTLNVLRYLASGHEIFYCAFVRSQQEAEALEMLHPLCTRLLPVLLRRHWLKDATFFIKSLWQNRSFLLLRDEEPEMHSALSTLLLKEQIDLVYVDQLNMWQFVPSSWHGPRVLDAHNALWLLIERLRVSSRNPWRRILLRREIGLLRREEGAACQQADLVLAVSEQDRQALLEVAGNDASIEIVPITFDVARYATSQQQRSPVPAHLLSIGTLYWPPNSDGLLWWLRDGYPFLQKQCPTVTYDIVGARPPRDLSQLAGHLPGIRMHGYVENVETFWRQASLLAVPLLAGGGTRVKILEAMARGIPVVTTSVGCEGLDVEHEKHLLIADTPEDFATACVRLIQDQTLARNLAERALSLVTDLYGLQRLEALENLLTSLMNHG